MLIHEKGHHGIIASDRLCQNLQGRRVAPHDQLFDELMKEVSFILIPPPQKKGVTQHTNRTKALLTQFFYTSDMS